MAAPRLRPLWLALGWAMVAGIVWLSLTPAPPKLDFALSDKVGHLVGYGVLMFWFCQLYPARGTRTGYALAFAVMGVGLEFVQDALGYRTLEEWDMIANTLGVGLGWMTAWTAGPPLFSRIEAWLNPKA